MNDLLSLSNPVFAVYAIAASLMILKTVGMAWLTVFQMMRYRTGYRAPEDARKTPLNPEPRPGQTAPDERVERIRRIHMNDLENVPFFLVAGFLWVMTEPSLTEARIVLYGYVISRLLHFLAYLTAQIHDIRATLWTIGVLAIVYMSVEVILAALTA